MVSAVIAVVSAVFFAAALVGVVLAVDPIGLEEACTDRPYSCGVGTGLLATFLVAGFGGLFWLGVRPDRLVSRYRRLAREDPQTLIDEVIPVDTVARKQLYELIKADVSIRPNRPQLIAGAIGTGKTTTLSELTKRLAAAGNVPVPIDLAKAEQELDFVELARISFTERATQWMLREDEGFAVWQRLSRDGRLVILADGLGEALRKAPGRDTAIARAVAQAADQPYGLVITARPEDVPAGLNVARFELDPLGLREATDFVVAKAGMTADRERIMELLRRGELTETPFYLRYVAELHAAGRLEALCVSERSRFGLRVDLLRTYIDGLIAGTVRSDAVLLSSRRKELVAYLGLAAYHGFVEGPDIALDRLAIPDPRRTAADGETLGFVRSRWGIIRFRQVILQGYLAACHVVAQLDWRAATQKLLDRSGDAWIAAAITAGLLATSDPEAAEHIGLMVVTVAERQTTALRSALAAAAVDIATVLPLGHGADLRDRIDALVQSTPPRPFRGAFASREIELVSRLSALSGIEAARSLWKLARDDEYLVRVSAAQQLATFGDIAVGVLETAFDEDMKLAEEAFGTGGQIPGLATEIDAARSLRLGVQCWMLPSLHAMVSSGEDWTRCLLRRWMGISWAHAYPGTEASLAQGFKFAAMNSRKSPRDTELMSFAQQLLGSSRFWYSQINLLHALTLWRTRPGPATIEHPLAVRTEELCATARGGQVRPYVWADEITVTVRPSYPPGNLKAAQGWQELHPEASKLMADVIVLLNLIEGDSRAIPHRAARLASALSRFPDCMREGSARTRLAVTGSTASDQSNCTARCKLNLCPYPARSEPTFRGELPEAFCREQARLHSSNAYMRAFWNSMEERVRD